MILREVYICGSSLYIQICMDEETSPMKKLKSLSDTVKKELSGDSSFGKVTGSIGKEATKLAQKTKKAVKETAEFAKNRVTGKKGIPVELLLLLL